SAKPVGVGAASQRFIPIRRTIWIADCISRHHKSWNLSNEMPLWLSKRSLRGDLRFARTAQFPASVATTTKKVTSNENHKETTNRPARCAFARHRKPVLCTERCALYRRHGLEHHDGQNQVRHDRRIPQEPRQDLEGHP